MIPTHIPIYQGLVVFKRVPTGQTPTIVSARCNCASSKADETARYIDANRNLFITAEDFKAGNYEPL
jgi:hypothetical protein